MKLYSPFDYRNRALTLTTPTHETLLRRLARVGATIALLFVATSTLAAGPKAYVGNFKDNTVTVIDTTTGTVVATIPVAAGPHGMGVTPDGRRVFVTGENTSGMSVIDTANDRVIQTIEVARHRTASP